jgi:hypothetical protein
MAERLGNHIPSNFKIYTNKAFLYKDYQFGSETPQNRRFFILNQNPFNDQCLITVSATTNIEGRKAARKDLPEVLVEIPKGTCKYITEPSIVDCLSHKTWYKPELEKKMKSGIVTPLDPLPTDIMEQLYRAIGHNTEIPNMDKRLVFPEK